LLGTLLARGVQGTVRRDRLHRARPPSRRAAQKLADEAPATKKEDVYKINVLNMTKMGRRFSYFVTKLAEMLKKDHATSPARSASLVILPNTGK
jgi:hypothetical protein